MNDALISALKARDAKPEVDCQVLARILMGTPDMRGERYPVMQQAAPLAPTMREQSAALMAMLAKRPEELTEAEKPIVATLEGFLMQGGPMGMPPQKIGGFLGGLLGPPSPMRRGLLDDGGSAAELLPPYK